MKTFKDFILEREAAPELDGKTTMDFIMKNCSKYLRENNDPTMNIMWRGMPFKSQGSVVKTVRKDRKPVDTNFKVHGILDEWFNDTFGLRARSQGLFVTGDMKQAGTYGERFIIFPVGDYKYVWSPEVRDLLKVAKSDIALVLRDKPQSDHESAIRGIMDGLNYQTDGLVEALRTKHEVVMMCDQYIAVPYHLYDSDLRYRLEYM